MDSFEKFIYENLADRIYEIIKKRDFYEVKTFLKKLKLEEIELIEKFNKNLLIDLLEILSDEELEDILTEKDIISKFYVGNNIFIDEKGIKFEIQKYLIKRVRNFNKRVFYEYLLDNDFIWKLFITFDDFLKKISEFNEKDEIKLLMDYIFRVGSEIYEKRDYLYKFLAESDVLKYIIKYADFATFMAFMRTYFHVDEKIIDEIIKKYCLLISEKLKKIYINKNNRLDVRIMNKLFDCLLNKNKKVIIDYFNAFEYKFDKEEDIEIVKDMLDKCLNINSDNYKKYEKIMEKYNLKIKNCQEKIDELSIFDVFDI